MIIILFAELDQHFEQPAEEMNADQRQIRFAPWIKIAPLHLQVGNIELFAKNESRLIDCAHPRVKVRGGKCEAEKILALRRGFQCR